MRELTRQKFTKKRPATRVEAWLIAWQAEVDDAPLSRREAAEWWCWGDTMARRLLAEVRGMMAEDERWRPDTPRTPRQATPLPPHPTKVERRKRRTERPKPPHLYPDNTPPSRARTIVDRDSDRDTLPPSPPPGGIEGIGLPEDVLLDVRYIVESTCDHNPEYLPGLLAPTTSMLEEIKRRIGKKHGGVTIRMRDLREAVVHVAREQ